MAETILAILDNDIPVLTVSNAFRWYLHPRIFFHEGIGVRTFTALYSHGIIINGHIAVLYQYVLHHVKVDGIGGRTFGIVGSAEAVNPASEEFHVLGIIYVVSPESGVLEVHALNLNVLAVGDIDEARALLVLVSAGFVPFATKPELLMVL